MRRIVFLDRDGTINIDHGHVYRVADWDFVPGAVEALAMLQRAGFLLAVVTNQSGVGEELYSEADVGKLHEHMRRALGEAGVTLDAIAHCPHARDAECDCRKPRTGMAAAILERLSIPVDLPASWTIGDKESDVQFGERVGTATALLRSRYWTDGQLSSSPTLVTTTLLDAAKWILVGGTDHER